MADLKSQNESNRGAEISEIVFTESKKNTEKISGASREMQLPKKNYKKKKGNLTRKEESSDDEEFNKILEDISALSTSRKKESVEAVEAETEVGIVLEEGKQEVEDYEEMAKSKASKNKIKKEKKKKAKILRQEAQNSGSTEETVKPEDHTSASKKPLSQAARLAAERQRKLKELEEQAKREEEERKRLEEEERLKEEEEERQRQLILEKKRLQRKEKRVRLKREGKPISAKEKAAAQMKKNFLESLGLSGIKTQNSSYEDQSKIKPSSYGKRKSKKAQGYKDAEAEPEEEEKMEELEIQSSLTSDSHSEIADDFTLENWEELEELECKKDEHTKKSDDTTLIPKSAQEIAEEHGALQNDAEDSLEYRSPICCVLGHVDTGKTKLLDKIRHSNVQNFEAGGITQQIGATFFPKEMLDPHCHRLNPDFNLKCPGLLIIDTPGHESFNNLRARGSSLCDIAILVVDIMHGLEPQTIESINLLRARKCYFLIAMNKIDRLYNWKISPWATFRETFDNQNLDTKMEFEERTKSLMLQLSEQGLNSALYWENDNVKTNISVCPTSAITGEGIPDLLALILRLTQELMVKSITYKDEFHCSILEVKTIEGLGTTVDVILLSGIINEGDKIVLCGISGPIVTTIRTLLTPQPLAELRVKGEYMKHTSIKAAMGVKIVAHGLEEAVVGTELHVVDPQKDEEEQLKRLCEDVMQDMSSIFDSVDRTGVGVYVMASTLGSLEALLQFLTQKKIPIFSVNIGPVQKKDVKKAAIMREKGYQEYSVILAFDVKLTPDAEKEASILGVKIMTADIIYHLLDSFLKYLDEQKEQKKQARLSNAIFPCELSVLPNCIFNKRDPFVFGVRVNGGILKAGTPLVAVTKGSHLMLGRVASMENNKKNVDKATKGQEICIKVVGEPNIAYGRHFDHTDKVYSRITRDSIDTLKDYFRDEMTSVCS